MYEKEIESNLFDSSLQHYGKIFDIVRIVDPKEGKVINIKNNEETPDDIMCYSILLNNEMCKNCISMKALSENNTFMKIQHNSNNMYLMIATPIEINGQIFALELLKNITDNLVFETVDHIQGHEVRNITPDLNDLIMKDPLIGIYNRRYIDQTLPLEISKSLHANQHLSIAMIDIDNFKQINDTYGHNAGDIIIKKIGRILTNNIRDDVDWVGRYGGDELLVCLKNVDNDKAYKILERVRKFIDSNDFKVEDKKIHITASFGLCTVKGKEISAVDLIKCADEKLYEAKNQGRNKLVT